MSQPALRLAGSLAVPVLILISAALLLPQLRSVPHAQAVLIPHLPYVVIGLGLTLSWRFNHSRTFFALSVLLLAYVGLQYGLPYGAPRGLRQQAIYNLTGMLVPVLLTAICVLKDRGIFSPRALSRFLLMLVPVVGIAAMIHWRIAGLASLLPRELLQAGHLGWTPLPLPVLATSVAASAVLSLRLAFYRSTLDGLTIAGLIGVALALHTGVQPLSTAVFFGAIALLFTTGVIQDGYRKAYLDELTGLAGRRALEEELLKLSGQYVVAMADVDHFKRFNDTHGHDVGDQVLRMVATQLSSIGGGGRPFRYGGEEFSIVFPGKSADTVVTHLEEVRERISSMPFFIRGRGRKKHVDQTKVRGRSGGGRRTSVTVSIGLAERGERLARPQDVLKEADKALYRAKRGGRNRVSD
jgi:diguanylate cyclase (GGDEF)-like protein